MVLAFWAYTWWNFSQVPYLELASIGSDPNARSGRGYTEGRHIGTSLLYGETELRYTIWQWFGIITAVNVHSAGEPGQQGIFSDQPRFQYWSPAVVVGAREDGTVPFAEVRVGTALRTRCQGDRPRRNSADDHGPDRNPNCDHGEKRHDQAQSFRVQLRAHSPL